MGRKHKKVLEHSSKRGRIMNEANTYEALETAKDVLWHIHIGNPSWGDEWYNAVRYKLYDSALRIVEQRGKGESFITAISTLHEVADLEARLKSFDR